jgi:hypothetical protein
MSDINVVEQQPAGGGVNKPASGTYGERAELEALHQELPSGGAAPPPGPGVAPMGGPASPGALPGGPPAGLPAGLLSPTGRPGVPGFSPLEDGLPQDPMAGAVDPQQQRMLLLDALAEHPEASTEVREWARVVREKLISRGS